MNNKGQVILILILVMSVALAIGLSVVQKSLVDVSTASKVEQSSRAFSAAEAGIEKALIGDLSSQIFAETSSKIASIIDSGLCVPGQTGCAQAAGQRQAALEFPPLAKEEVAHIWLADFNYDDNPPAYFYGPPEPRRMDVYWGNSDSEKAALLLTLVYYDSTDYGWKKWYLDHPASSRDNQFDKSSDCTGRTLPSGKQYQCYKQLDLSSLPEGLMLIRARLLYNNTPQPFAVQAVGNCGRACSLPRQVREIVSTGVSGETQRKVQLFQLNKVVPPLFDYAIFSAGEISK